MLLYIFLCVYAGLNKKLPQNMYMLILMFCNKLFLWTKNMYQQKKCECVKIKRVFLKKGNETIFSACSYDFSP